MADQPLPSISGAKPGAAVVAPSASAMPVIPEGHSSKDVAALPQHAVDTMTAVSTASSAIQTSLTIAQFALGGFALFFTLIAVVGYAEIRRKTTKRAVKLAMERLDKHLESEQVKNAIDQAIETAVQRRISGNLLVIAPSPASPVAPPPPSSPSGGS